MRTGEESKKNRRSRRSRRKTYKKPLITPTLRVGNNKKTTQASDCKNPERITIGFLPNLSETAPETTEERRHPTKTRTMNTDAQLSYSSSSNEMKPRKEEKNEKRKKGEGGRSRGTRKQCKFASTRRNQGALSK
jgi:hypothetical protein